MSDSKHSKEPIPLRPKNGRAAPSKGAGKRTASIKRFWGELRAEFKKIIWPSRHQLTTNTIVVLVTMVVIGAVVMGLDALCITGFNALVK